MLCAGTLLLASCAAHDPHAYLQKELVFLKTGVNLDDEEQQVRRVLAQRNLRVVSRFDPPCPALSGQRAPAVLPAVEMTGPTAETPGKSVADPRR